ncbi:hypothetical protein Tco_1445579, partial [Tanacetum coccineum]
QQVATTTAAAVATTAGSSSTTAGSSSTTTAAAVATSVTHHRSSSSHHRSSSSHRRHSSSHHKMKAMKDHIRAGIIPFKTDQEILDEIVPSDNWQNMSGRGMKLPGGSSTSRRYANRAFGDVMSREQIT